MRFAAQVPVAVLLALGAFGGTPAGCASAKKDPSAESVKIVKKTAEIPGAGSDYLGADVSYPEFVMPNEDARKRLEAAAGLKAGTDMSLEECKAEVADGTWLREIDYTVDYNRNDILSLTYTVSGMGAHPSESMHRLSVRVSTGRPLSVEETFRPEGRKTLAGFIDQRLQKAIAAKLDELEEEDQAELQEMLDSRKGGKPVFRVRNMEGFQVVDDGVAFFYEFDFPHAYLAREPDESFVLSFHELWTFLEKKGPLGFASEPDEKYRLN
ncbi:MAG TPA: hypothetical protein VGS22_30490 [Thermoanaerobaculia bacterium]|jgi:hypothetical protein|nr:hypothetical protein [Thermoanaerobaculia bacterium]